MNSYIDNLRTFISTLITAQRQTFTKLSEKESNGIAAQIKLDDNSIAKTTAESHLLNQLHNLKSWAKALHVTNQDSVSVASNLATKNQYTANSIEKLSAHVHHIFAIVNAADYGSEIFSLAKSVDHLMSLTTNLATEISEQSLKIDEDLAKIEVEKLITEVETAIQNFTITVSDSKEGSSEAGLALVRAELSASKKANQLINKHLNLDLSANLEFDSSNFKCIDLSFHPMLHPFNSNEAEHADNIVESYYVFVAKNEGSKTFTIEQAERLIYSGEHKKEYFLLPKNEIKPGVLSHFKLTKLADTEGNPLDFNSTYTVYLFAQLKNDFKRERGDFEDFLSAPIYIASNHSEKTTTGFLKGNPIPALNSILLNESSQKAKPQSITKIKETVNVNQKRMLYLTKKINSLITEQQNLVRKLIFSLQCLSKFSSMIVKKKAMNPEISDELITLISIAETESSSVFDSTLGSLKISCDLLPLVLKSDEILSITAPELANLQEALL